MWLKKTTKNKKKHAKKKLSYYGKKKDSHARTAIFPWSVDTVIKQAHF